MRFNPPGWLRVAIYAGNALLAPVFIYGLTKNWIGEAEMQLWAGEVAAAFALAGLNVPGPPE